MLFNVIVLSALVAGVVAQTPDACILTCSTQALTSSTCTALTDFQCVCTSGPFQTAAAACLAANCTTDDVTNAVGISQVECAGVPGSLVPSSNSTSASGSASGSPSATGSAAKSSGTAPASPSGSAGTTKPSSGANKLAAAGSAALAVVGGAIALL